MSADPEKLLTVKDVLARLNISRTTLWRLVKNREIEAIRVGKQLRFERSAIESYIQIGTIPVKK
jgi:excisionase family DNA binding protein